MGQLNSQVNRAVWFDIPVADLDRAAKFYREVLNIGVDKETYGGFSFGVFDHKDGNGGCLVRQQSKKSRLVACCCISTRTAAFATP